MLHVQFIFADWSVLCALLDAPLPLLFVQLPVHLMPLPEVRDHEFLKEADVDDVKHCHDLA